MTQLRSATHGAAARRARALVRRACLAGALAALAAGAATAHANTLPAEAITAVEQVTGQGRYANSTWGILVQDAVTGEHVYGVNPHSMFVPGSITKAFTSAAALQASGPARRFVTPVHRVGTVRRGTLDGNLVLVASGDFSFGLRETPQGTLQYADGGGDHNEANSLQMTTSVSGQPLRALDALATAVRRSGVRRVTGDVVIDDRLFRTQRTWPDGEITPIWVNENLIDITVRPGASGSAARVSYRPRTAAYRVVSRVRTAGAGAETSLDVTETSPGVITISGRIAAGGGPTVRTYLVDDAQAFARTAFIEALRRKGVAVTADSTGPNPVAKLPRSRTYPAATRLGRWVSPTFSEYVKVVLKVSYNRGADLLACLTGVRAGLRDCDGGLASTTDRLIGLGVPAESFFNYDGAGSDDRNRVTPAVLNRLMSVASQQPWSQSFLDALPQLGVPGGGDLGAFGVGTPAAGAFTGKTGTRAGSPPGSPFLLLEARGMAGYLRGASGRSLLVSVVVNNTPVAALGEMLGVIDDQVRIVNIIHGAT